MNLDTAIKSAGILLGNVVVNFGYQAMAGKKWGQAVEISYFQAGAILAAWFAFCP